jgi:hypothetical protein
MSNEIINKVANSSLVSFDLEDYYPSNDRVEYDIEQNLFQSLMLREKDFRSFIREHDWLQYNNKFVAIGCSVDAVVPTWAYMLLATKLEGIAAKVVFGTISELNDSVLIDRLKEIDYDQYQEARVVVKGCSKYPISTNVYVFLSTQLKPRVKSLMFGEPCSTVPIYKKVVLKR